ncbi:MAG: segregation/condensation protein A [Patescibacteria group bacterium]|nr:segregation/condensation protein A [Patescibacteria group bacterium]
MLKVSQEQFEGPLDLLLQLIEAEKLEITKISLAKITDEYINCLSKLDERDYNIAEFLLIASKLIYLKSKVLLPQIANSEEEEEIEDLERRLIEYKKYKEAAQAFNTILEERKRSYRRQGIFDLDLRNFSPPESVDINMLLEILKNTLSKMPKEEIEKGEKEIEKAVSVEEKVTELKDYLSKKKKAKFSELLKKVKTKHEIIVSFLAILDLLKQKVISAEQDKHFGDIIIREI